LPARPFWEMLNDEEPAAVSWERFWKGGYGRLEPVWFFVLWGAQWLALLGIGALVLGAYHEISRLDGVIGGLRSEMITLRPSASRLQRGDRLPTDLEIPLPPRAFVLVLSYGCSGCIDISRKLEGVGLGNWELLAVVTGRPPSRPTDLSSAQGLPAEHLAELLADTIPLPSHAHPFYDPERKWVRELGLTVLPTGLAFVGGRMVDQMAGPDLAWFIDVPSKRRARWKEVLEAGRQREAPPAGHEVAGSIV